MCGIAGILIQPNAAATCDLDSIVHRMAVSLSHRGPDSDGFWIDRDAGIALGHRRLAIIDLSPTGYQPMLSADGRYVISYNGEVYNYRELRDELVASGARLRGTSDTEVLLEACARWGVAETARRACGIFAFALWDRTLHRLTLVRDHVGIKPLYWAHFGGTTIFGSELKALRQAPGWEPELDRDVVATFFQLGYVPAPWTVYRGVRKLPAGSLLVVEPGKEPAVERYWDARAVARAGVANPLDLPDDELIDALESLLGKVVPQQMIADVPVGVFLSGGIDSSTVAAVAQSKRGEPVRTFSIGFAGTPFDESQFAKRVAQRLGTDHTELQVDGAAALDVIPRLPTMFDEPQADFSQIPTYLVSALARKEVTVALTGDGGDELFGGYSWYRHRHALSRWCANSPAALKSGLASTARLASSAVAALGAADLRNRLGKLADILLDPTPDPVMHCGVMRWAAADNPVIGAAPAPTVHDDAAMARGLPNLFERRQLVDLLLYLPDDLLVKVDRASMAVALEARVPLLDPRLIEFAWRLPLRARARDGTGKWALRQLLYRHVPRELVDRPKMGFVPPAGEWMRGPCRDWGESLIGESRLRRQGILDPARVRRRWAEHQSGKADWTHALWAVLMFEAWHDRWMGPAAVAPEPERLQAVPA